MSINIRKAINYLRAENAEIDRRVEKDKEERLPIPKTVFDRRAAVQKTILGLEDLLNPPRLQGTNGSQARKRGNNVGQTAKS